MWDLLRTLVSQDRAVANAREAATAMSRLRVQREEVQIFLAGLEPGRAGAASGPRTGGRVEAAGR